MARRKKMELPKTELNITSMMDLVLNLLMFFVLLSNFAMAELPMMNPPAPLESRAQPSEATDKVAINILPVLENGVATGRAAAYKFGVDELATTDTDGLIQRLAFERAKSEKNKSELTIDLRADEGLTYEAVQPVMAAIKT